MCDVSGENPQEPRRIFIGIKLHEDLAETFAEMQKALGELPLRLIPPKDIHLTLVPPFKTMDVSSVENELRRALLDKHSFSLRFLNVELGPHKRRPRLIWVDCEASAELVLLQRALMPAFQHQEARPFAPHMTLVRFKPTDAKTIKRRFKPRPIQLSMPVRSVELFESLGGGEGYKVLAAVPLLPLRDIPDKEGMREW